MAFRSKMREIRIRLRHQRLSSISIKTVGSRGSLGTMIRKVRSWTLGDSFLKGKRTSQIRRIIVSSTMSSPMADGTMSIMRTQSIVPRNAPMHAIWSNMRKAGELILDLSRLAAHELLPTNQEILIYKNNSDYKGHSYGAHEII